MRLAVDRLIESDQAEAAARPTELTSSELDSVSGGGPGSNAACATAGGVAGAGGPVASGIVAGGCTYFANLYYYGGTFGQHKAY